MRWNPALLWLTLPLLIAIPLHAAEPSKAGPSEADQLLAALPTQSAADQQRTIQRLTRLIIDKVIPQNDPRTIAALAKVLFAGGEPANEAQSALGFAGLDALKPARDAIRSKDGDTSSRGASVIWYLALLHPNDHDRFAAVVPDLAACLDRPDGPRNNAIYALTAIGIPAKKELLKLLGTTSGVELRVVINGLVDIGKEVLPDLLEAIRSNSPTLRSTAVNVIGRLKEFPPQAVAPVATLLKDDDATVRESAAGALRAAGPVAHAAADDLVAALQRHPAEYYAYTTALAAVHPDPKHAPLLLALIPPEANSNDRPRHPFRAALAAIDPPPVDELTRAITDPRPGVTMVALETLSELGPRAKPAVPELIKTLDNKDLWISAANTLAAIGPDSKDAIPALTPHLTDGQLAIMRTTATRLDSPAAYALGLIGPDALPAVMECLNDRDEMVQMGAVWALALIAINHPEPATASLLKFAQSDASKNPRRLVLSLLAQSRLDPARLRPVLETLKGDAAVGIVAIAVLKMLDAQATQPAATKPALRPSDLDPQFPER